MISLFLVFTMAGFILFEMNKFYRVRELSLKSENKKYKYTLLIVKQNSAGTIVNLYSDFSKYTVDDLMNRIWDKESKAYVLKLDNAIINLCTINNLYSCEFSVEKVGDEE